MFASPIARLIQQLGQAAGHRREDRGAAGVPHPARAPEDAAALAAAIGEVKEKIRLCSVCCNLTEADPCAICRDARRDAGWSAWSRSRRTSSPSSGPAGYRGRYHVLHGVLSPLDGIGPDDLRVAELVAARSRRARTSRSRGHPGDQPQRRRGGDRRLPRQAAPAARACGPPASPPACPSAASSSTPTRLTLTRAIDGRREM